MNSQQLARYLELTDSIAKPWLLVQLRLKKLQERRHEISTEVLYRRTGRYSPGYDEFRRMVERNRG